MAGLGKSPGLLKLLSLGQASPLLTFHSTLTSGVETGTVGFVSRVTSRLQIAQGLANPSRNSRFKGRESYQFNSGESLAIENGEGGSTTKEGCEHN